MRPRRTTRRFRLLPALGLALSIASSSVAAARDGARVVHLVAVPAHLSWHDDAYLAAVAAAAQANGKPIALAVDPEAPWRPELLDFLRRYEAERLIWVGPSTVEPPEGMTLQRLECDSAGSAARVLAMATWSTASRAVLYDPADRSSALSAAALAARLRAALFPVIEGVPSAEDRSVLAQLGVERALLVGLRERIELDGLATEALAGPEEVVRWMARNDLPVGYLAATNPEDARLCGGRRLSLAAVVLAAGRGGAVAPLSYDTRWKCAFPTTEELADAPRGAQVSRTPLRRGALDLDGAVLSFLTGCEAADGHWWAQLDRDGNGAFDGPGEGRVGTGETLEIGGRTWVADLDVQEDARGQSLWLTFPAPEIVRADLARFRAAAGAGCEMLCLVGWPDALPPAVIDHGQGIDTDLVSDLPYAGTDADPFVELAFARFVAEDLPSATLLACRGLVYDDLSERGFTRRFATAEWEGIARETLEGAGLTFAGHHDGGALIDAASPLTDVGLIVHGSHAMWTAMGATYAWDSTTLLAPCLVESSGCSVASLDQDAEHRSVPARLLRNGALAFIGNSRRGIAQAELFRSEVWNALLARQSLGQANRAALNRLIVATLEKGEPRGGPHYYQLYNHAVLGDPALVLDLPRRPGLRPARVELHGTLAILHAPQRWSRFEYEPLAEWGCSFPRLTSWRGAGMTSEAWWHDGEKRNEEALYFTAEVRTRLEVESVEPLDEPPAPLGWTGTCFVDEHPDGSRSLFWRARLIDFDMTRGEVRAEVDRLRFRLGPE